MNTYISADTTFLNLFILLLQGAIAVYSLFVLGACCRRISCVGALLSAIVLVVWSYRFPTQELIPVMDIAHFLKGSTLLTFLIGGVSSVMLVAAYKYRESSAMCAVLVFGVTLILFAGTLDVSLTSNIATAAVAGKSIGLTFSYASFGK